MEITGISNISIKEVTDGRIIGIANVSDNGDKLGNHTITPALTANNCKYNSETGDWIWDGEYSFASLDLGTDILASYPISASYLDSTVKLGIDAYDNLEAETMRGFVFFDRTLNTYEEEVLDKWYESLSPINRQIQYVTESAENAQEWIDLRENDEFYELSDAYIPIYQAALSTLGLSGGSLLP